jgi:drug/metabolite transporter (DMT)-like permease
MSLRARFYTSLGLHTLFASGTYILGKGATAHIPVLALGFLRFAMAGVCFTFLAAAGRMDLRSAWREDRRGFLLSGFLGVLLNQVTFLWGLKLTLPAHASLLYALTPTMVLLLAWMQGQERPTARKLAGLAMAFLGVAVLFLDGRRAVLPRGWMLGDLLIVVAMLSWAGYTVVSRPLVLRHGAPRATAITTLAGCVLFLPVGLPGLAGFHPGAVPASAWLGALYLGIISSVVMYLLWFQALSLKEPSRVAIASNLQPILTAGLGWLFLGHTVSPTFGLGAALVIGGVVLTQI